MSNIIFIIIFLLSSLGQIFNDFFASSFYLLSKDFLIAIKTSQWFISIYMLGFFFSQFIYPIVSDSFGRKKPLMIGMFFCIIGSLLCCLSHDLNVFLIGRFFQGLGAGAGITMVRPILCDISSTKQFASYNSYIEIFTGLMIIFSAYLGSIISFFSHDWRPNFAIMSAYCFILMILIFKFIPETISPSSKVSFKYSNFNFNFKKIIQNSNFIKYSLIASITYGGIYIWMTILPVLFQKTLQFSQIKYSFFYMVPTIGFMSGALLNACFLKKTNPSTLILGGVLLECLSGIELIFFHSPYAVIIMISIYMIGAGLIFPNTTSITLKQFPDYYGTASGIYSSIFIFGGWLSSSLLAILKNMGIHTLSWGFILCGLTCMGLKLSMMDLKLRKYSPPKDHLHP